MFHPLLILLISLTGVICASRTAEGLDYDRTENRKQHREDLLQGGN